MKQKFIILALSISFVLSCSKESPIQGINTTSSYSSNSSTIGNVTILQPISWSPTIATAFLNSTLATNIGFRSFYYLSPQSNSSGTFQAYLYPMNLTGYSIEFASDIASNLKLYSKGDKISDLDFKIVNASSYRLSLGIYSNLATNSTDFSNANFSITNSSSLNFNQEKYIAYRIRDFNNNYVQYGWVTCYLKKENLSFVKYGYLSSNNLNAGI